MSERLTVVFDAETLHTALRVALTRRRQRAKEPANVPAAAILGDTAGLRQSLVPSLTNLLLARGTIQ